MNNVRTCLVLTAAVVFAIFYSAGAFAHTEHARPAQSAPTVPEPGPAGKASDVEEIEVAEVAEVKVPSAGQPSILDLLSRLHPPLVHMPIAWLILLVMVDAATFLFKKPWEKAGLYVGALTAASCIPAAVTGLLREQFHTGDPSVKSLIATHKWLAIGMAAMVITAVAIRFVSRGRLENIRKYAYLALVFGAGGLVALVGHKGGQIVFGVDFLRLPF